MEGIEPIGINIMEPPNVRSELYLETGVASRCEVSWLWNRIGLFRWLGVSHISWPGPKKIEPNQTFLLRLIRF